MIFKDSTGAEVSQRPDAVKFSADFNVTQDDAGEMNIAKKHVDTVSVVTATKTVTAAETGTTFFLSAAAGFTTTLPTATAGLRYKFIVITAPTSNGYTIVGTPDDRIFGTVAASGAEATINGQRNPSR
jgi:hypothetical protein